MKKKYGISGFLGYKAEIGNLVIIHPGFNGLLMKVMLISMLVLVVLLASVFDVQAQTVYCVRAGATGTNNGSDWNNAFSTLPATLVRGATYYIADGKYAAYKFDDSVSGTSVITIKKATASDHGTEIGWDSSYGDGKATFEAITFATDDWVFDGVTGGGPGSWMSGHGFEVGPTNGASDVITLSGARDNITIRHVDAHVYPIVKSKEEMTIFKSVLRGTTGSCSNITFSYVWFHHAFGCGFHISQQWSGPAVLEYSYISHTAGMGNQHASAMSIYEGADNFTVRYNIFYDIQGTAFIAGLGYSSHLNNWEVYGNVFTHSGTFNVVVSAVIGVYYIESTPPRLIRSNNWKVYNNSIINVKGYARMTWPDPEGTNIFVYNNLFDGNRTGPEYVNTVYISGPGVTWDYNWYTRTAHPRAYKPGPHENALYYGGYCNLSVDTTNYFVNWQNGDYRLSKATSTGKALPSPCNHDMYSRMRGKDGVWDRGALEFSGSEFPPNPPKQLRIIQ
ncbi:MAG: hypothetical protein A2169_05290 [Deltaproteobacteria bacterium RBG_13_47_9]|nr:MAG: hypothetical protein A2169_05290 [Deltaproteobacteria bacterium RBG_13_47_9]